MNEFLTRAKHIADYIKTQKEVLVVSHIDADGISAASIAVKALENAGIEYKVKFLKQLDLENIEIIKNLNIPLTWITDMGSGVLHLLSGLNVVVTDHHAPSQQVPEVPVSKRKSLDTFFEAISRTEMFHLNPHVFGKNGATDISGAGTTYLVAREMDTQNIKMSPMAIVGAIGDLQDSTFSRLTGTNRIILKEAKDAKLIDYYIDARFFGKETRPLHKMLQYTFDPVIPTISNDYFGTLRFLENLNIPLKTEQGWRRWIDLTVEEKRKILSALVILILKMGYGAVAAERLIGEVYVLLNEEPGTLLRDAKEYATLLNACGRYGKAETALAVALGDRENQYKNAITYLNKHRKTLSDGIAFVKDLGVIRLNYVQYFHSGNNIPETVIGTVASMALSSGVASPELPIIGFAETDNGMIKVSARAPRTLIDKGLNLAKIISNTAKIVGGYGGGHNIAAGASIPQGKEEELIMLIDAQISKALKKT